MMKTYTKKIALDNYEYIEMTEEDGTIRFVPIADDNSDYQAYLRWLNGEKEPSGTL